MALRKENNLLEALLTKTVETRTVVSEKIRYEMMNFFFLKKNLMIFFFFFFLEIGAP